MKKDNIVKRIWIVAKYILIPVALVIGFFYLFQLTDWISGGLVADWIDKMFVYEYWSSDIEGNSVIVRTFDWERIKVFLLYVLLVVIPLICIIVLVFIDRKKRKLKKKLARQVSEYITRFVLNGEPMPADIPEEYAEVFAKLSEVKYAENKREQDLLNETQRKDDLVTYLAHDLKTPLTSVIGYLTLLKDEKSISEDMRERYTNIAVKKSERLEVLINELFEITRYNIHNVELEKGNVNFSVMLAQIVFEFEPSLAEKHLRFETDIEDGIELYIDADRVERVVDNLIRNALHYSYPDTEIKVSLSKFNDDQNKMWARLMVENHGKTIPKEKLLRVFEQFYRVDSSRSSTTGGSGLGLAIAKQLVEAHGGTIAVDSENEMIRFVVELPKEAL